MQQTVKRLLKKDPITCILAIAILILIIYYSFNFDYFNNELFSNKTDYYVQDYPYQYDGYWMFDSFYGGSKHNLLLVNIGLIPKDDQYKEVMGKVYLYNIDNKTKTEFGTIKKIHDGGAIIKRDNGETVMLHDLIIGDEISAKLDSFEDAGAGGVLLRSLGFDQESKYKSHDISQSGYKVPKELMDHVIQSNNIKPLDNMYDNILPKSKIQNSLLSDLHPTQCNYNNIDNVFYSKATPDNLFNPTVTYNSVSMSEESLIEKTQPTYTENINFKFKIVFVTSCPNMALKDNVPATAKHVLLSDDILYVDPSDNTKINPTLTIDTDKILEAVGEDMMRNVSEMKLIVMVNSKTPDVVRYEYLKVMKSTCSPAGCYDFFTTSQILSYTINTSDLELQYNATITGQFDSDAGIPEVEETEETAEELKVVGISDESLALVPEIPKAEAEAEAEAETKLSKEVANICDDLGSIFYTSSTTNNIVNSTVKYTGNTKLNPGYTEEINFKIKVVFRLYCDSGDEKKPKLFTDDISYYNSGNNKVNPIVTINTDDILNHVGESVLRQIDQIKFSIYLLTRSGAIRWKTLSTINSNCSPAGCFDFFTTPSDLEFSISSEDIATEYEATEKGAFS